MIEATVLAAGESRRMGMPKPLLRFGATTFLEQIVGVLRRCDVGGITVVLGAQAEMIRARTDLSGVNVVVNENYRDGQLSSLIAGLHRGAGVPPLCPAGILPVARAQERGRDALATEDQGQDARATREAILVCLVDNPFISPDVVGRIIGAFRESYQPIVVPVFNGRRGHPALFAALVFDELLHAPVSEGARHVVNADRARVLEVEVPDSAILARIDTPEDYHAHFGIPPQIRAER
jgi:molybdenum cofactor cytidylyltransferase